VIVTPVKERGGKILSEEQRVLKILRENPQGMKLVDIGNQMGVNWRSLIGVMQMLLKERKVYRVNGVYFLGEYE
jgi:predicted transcriptional regulator